MWRAFVVYGRAAGPRMATLPRGALKGGMRGQSHQDSVSVSVLGSTARTTDSHQPSSRPTLANTIEPIVIAAHGSSIADSPATGGDCPGAGSGAVPSSL